MTDDFHGKNSYAAVLEEFSEQVVKARFLYLNSKMVEFIEMSNLEKRVRVSPAKLRHVVVDYFADMLWLKNFQGIERANRQKIVAYTVYWISRRQPLQIISEEGNPENVAWVNEKFAASMLAYACVTPSDDPTNMYDTRIRLEGYDLERFQNLQRQMLYHLQYRLVDAQNLELLLSTYETAFALGSSKAESVLAQ